jgi:hypothetical protein
MTMATTTAERLDDAGVSQELAVVERSGGEGLELRSAGGRYRARRAASCLLEPQVGDLVVVAVSERGHAWVLAVLERENEEQPLALRTDGDLEIHARGRLGLTGSQEVEVRSGRAGRFAAPRLTFTTFDLEAAVERLVLSGGSAEVNLERAKAAVTFVEQAFERLSTKAQRVYRYIEQLDLTRARQIELRAETTAHIRSKQTFMTSDDLVKVDAGQIHLG